ncbi:MAG: hypothetical protein FWD40_02365 [Treponema sp.]|nr:hypothetical protein [Treponema sp.]
MNNKSLKTVKFLLPLVLAVFCGLSSLFAQRAPINVNLIIDSSASFSAVKDEVTAWISSRLDEILVDEDRITVWSAGDEARIIYTARIDASAKEAVKRSIRDISPSGDNPDFSSALREAASNQSTPYGYTLLVSASSDALSSVIGNPQRNLLRFSRVEEFTSWRALVVGLNLDARVSRAATAYFNN